MLVLSWAAPFLIMAEGWYFFPVLDARVSLSATPPSDIWAGMFAQLFSTLIWVIYEIWYSTHRNTAVTQLQADAWGDFATTFALAFALGVLYDQSTIPYWFVVPLFGAFIDAGQSTLLAINNAAQKPGIGAKTGT